MSELTVETVAGRYPARGNKPLRKENVTAEVIASGDGRFVIRLEDASADEVWLHIAVRLEKGAT